MFLHISFRKRSTYEVSIPIATYSRGTGSLEARSGIGLDKPAIAGLVGEFHGIPLKRTMGQR